MSIQNGKNYLLYIDTVVNASIAIPSDVAATGSTTGGTLAADTYYYAVTALDANGETIASEEVEATTTGSTSSVALTWDTVAGASSYRVYKGTATGDYDEYFTATTNSKTDTGSAGTAGSPPELAYKTIVCLKSNGVELSVSSIDTTSKCTDGWADSIPGDGSWTMSGEGFAVGSTLTDEQVSEGALFTLAKNKQSFYIKTADVAASTIRRGIAYISSFSESFNNNEGYSFSATFTGRGEIYSS